MTHKDTHGEACTCHSCAPIAAVIDLPNGETVDGFRAAAAAGYPCRCEQFAACTNAATVVLAHPVLGAVPTCDRCAARVAELA